MMRQNHWESEESKREEAQEGCVVQTPAWLSHTCAPRHTPEKRGMKQETDGLFPALTSCPVHTSARHME